MAQVDTARRKLEAVRKGEIWPLTAGEKARLFAHIGRGAAKVVRGKSTNKADAAADRVLADAEERLKAEYDVLESDRKSKIREKAKAKVEKRSGSSWW
ncbi:hypothetical protein ACFZAV_42735 [Streptomyces sp. NPDC008343]|uniref:hypothetical protein n=1 Tax=Streptomyces sp. NPDC008343 TaxID=3364828 RepID=UPI0036EE64C2